MRSELSFNVNQAAVQYFLLGETYLSVSREVKGLDLFSRFSSISDTARVPLLFLDRVLNGARIRGCLRDRPHRSSEPVHPAVLGEAVVDKRQGHDAAHANDCIVHVGCSRCRIGGEEEDDEHEGHPEDGDDAAWKALNPKSKGA